MVTSGEAVEVRPDVGTISQVGIDRLQDAAELQILRNEHLPDTAPIFVVEVEERAVRQLRRSRTQWASAAPCARSLGQTRKV